LLRQGQLQYFTTQNGLSNNQVRAIYEDKNGTVWFECGRGLSRYDGRRMTVYQERNYRAKKKWASTRDDLWFKGDESVGYNQLERDPGVYRYDGHTLSYHTFPFPLNNTYSISTPFAKSKDGTVWFGTYNAVIGYNGSKFSLIDNTYLGLPNEKEQPILASANGYLGAPKEKLGLHIRSILADSKGNLWIGNNGSGVYKYDGKKAINFTEQQQRQATRGKQHLFASNTLLKVFSLGEDAFGNIWFGTLGSGVWKFDGHNLTNYTQKDGIGSDQIWTIYKSKTGEMWFGGANPSGVYKFTGKSFERKY
jgi:ligand-binding sensor domain-containing protein